MVREALGSTGGDRELASRLQSATAAHVLGWVAALRVQGGLANGLIC